jgi:hypothetical protein
MSIRTMVLAGAFVAASLAARPALALEDLTGTWLGSMTCDAVTAVDHEKTKVSVTVEIDDDPSGDAFLTLDGVTYDLAVLADPDAPTSKGRVVGQECNASSLGVDVLHLSVKAKDGSEKGTMTGVRIGSRTGIVHSATLCKVKLKRVDATIEIPIIGCPL